MKKKLRDLFYRFFDYDIVGDYFDTSGDGRYYHKYIKKYHLRCFKKKRGVKR